MFSIKWMKMLYWIEYWMLHRRGDEHGRGPRATNPMSASDSSPCATNPMRVSGSSPNPMWASGLSLRVTNPMLANKIGPHQRPVQFKFEKKMKMIKNLLSLTLRKGLRILGTYFFRNFQGSEIMTNWLIHSLTRVIHSHIDLFTHSLIQSPTI